MWVENLFVQSLIILSGALHDCFWQDTKVKSPLVHHSELLAVNSHDKPVWSFFCIVNQNLKWIGRHSLLSGFSMMEFTSPWFFLWSIRIFHNFWFCDKFARIRQLNWHHSVERMDGAWTYLMSRHLKRFLWFCQNIWWAVQIPTWKDFFLFCHHTHNPVHWQ